MREQITRQMPTVRLLDTEVPLYMGLARASRNLMPKKRGEAEVEAPVDLRNTLVVRAGIEDTLVLFMQDDTLRQCEILRSLTAYEAPETICSRVLLLQDEYGIGEVQQVLLLSEEREEDLVESFEMFFPDARVESMRQFVPEFQKEQGGDVATGTLVPAIAAALRVSNDSRYKNVFEDINLLPKQLLRRRLQLPVTWQVLAVYVLLFCSVLFFTARYFTQQSQIAEKQRSIQQFEQEVGPITVDAKQLQASIDSLQAVHERYMRSINVLEGLLQGSDKWSRALEKSSSEVANVSGIWIESWNPRNNGRGLELSGNATARDHVVELAQRLDGTIATLTFSEIRDWPVYSFKLNMPLENGLPKAAEYLRQRATDQAEQAAASVPVTSTSLQ
jgi:Tfp pilus assembly protein PilN